MFEKGRFLLVNLKKKRRQELAERYHGFMNVGDWIRKWSLIRPGKIAIIDDGKQFSYRELNNRSNQVANYLLKKGMRKGNRIAVLSYNGHEFIEIYLATAKIGGIFVPLNWRMAPDELAYVLNDCTPVVLFYAEEFADTCMALRERVEHIKHYITLGREGISHTERYEDTGSCPSTEPAGFQSATFEDPHIIMYTSGTTGFAKGAVLSNRKTFFNALNANIFFELTPNDIFIVSRPLFHSGGLLINSTPVFYKGATVIYKRRFGRQEFLDTVERYHVTIAEPAATFLNFILKECDLDQSNLRSLKSFFTGGERVPETLLKEYHGRGYPLSQLFGMTETSTLTWLPTADAIRKAGSVGKPVFHGEAEIVDKEARPVSPGEIGEMRVRGPILMSGYWNKPDETKQVMKDGWFYTGDLAKTDDQGFMYIIERAKDMYISGGENIHPTEVEKLLLTNPKIFDVAVYGVPDENWGQVGKASIVLKDGQRMSFEEVEGFLKGRIGSFKIPRYVEFVDELPRTASGKIKRYLLAERFKKGDVSKNV
jgi:fatty-acyl-CoA synthase